MNRDALTVAMLAYPFVAHDDSVQTIEFEWTYRPVGLKIEVSLVDSENDA